MYTNELFCAAVLLTAFFISLFAVPSLIYASLKYSLFDENDLYRKNHKRNVSRLGGIAIFTAFIFTAFLSSYIASDSETYVLLGSCVLLSLLGLKDDVYGSTTAGLKFGLQMVVAIILVSFGGIRLTSLYGVLGIWEMNALWGSLFSVALIIFLNNAFNLIDGIDGLAGSIGVLTSLVFGVLFALMDQMAYAFIALALCGAICGFLKYNWYPAKIFMGDTGALVIGLVTGVLAIKFIELNKFNVFIAKDSPHFYTAPARAVAILIIPIFDSLRIFGIRILNKKSPFRGDRNHIHHRLERIGYKPNQIVLLLITLNIFIVFFSVVFKGLGNFLLMLLIMVICMIFNGAITLKLKQVEKKSAV